MLVEPSTDYLNLSSLPDGMLKASLIPNLDRREEVFDRIDSYSKKLEFQSDEGRELFEQIKSEESKTNNGKQIILDELASADLKVKDILTRRKLLADSLLIDLEISDDGEFLSRVAESLIGCIDICSERQKGIISKINLSLRKKRQQDARIATRKLIEDLNSVDLQWKDILSSTDLPRELLENIDFVLQSIQLRKSFQIIDNGKNKISKSELKVVRAKVFSPLVGQGYSPEIVLDLIEGRYDLEDPVWNGNFVKAYLPISEFINKAENNTATSRRTRIILVGISSLFLSGVLLSKNNNSFELPNNFSPPASEISSGEALEEKINIQSSSSEMDGSFDGSQDGDQPQNAEYPPSSEDNATPENSGELDKTIYWEISGKVPEGNFRESVLSDFVFNTWRVDTGSSGKLYPAYVSSIPVDSPTKLTSVFPISRAGQRFNIPVPDGWEITYIQVGLTTQSVIKLSNSLSGSYVAELSADLGYPQTVSIGLKPIEEGQNNWTNAPYENNNKRETLDTTILIKDINNLDENTVVFLDKIKNDSSLSDEEKASKVTEFVRDHFIYSLNPKFSDFYLENTESGEYLRKAWQVGYGDCDVVNTVNVAFLRYVGLDARLVYGFANDSSLLNSSRRKLEGNEAHGWAQFYNTLSKKWEDADATPGVIDPDSLDELMDLNGGAGIESIFSIRSIKDLLRTLSLLFAKSADFASSDWGIVTKILSLITIYSVLYGLGSNLQSKNEKILQNFSNALQYGDGDPPWKLNNKLAEKINNIIRGVLASNSNYLSKWNTDFWDKILLFPRLIKASKDRKLVRPVSEILQHPQNLNYDPSNESVPDFVLRVAGIEKEKVIAHIQKEHLNISLKDIKSAFDTSVLDAFSSSLTRKYCKNGINPYAINFRESFKNYRNNDVLFVNSILEQLYKQYLSGIKEANKRRAREARKRNSAVEYRDTILPKDNNVRIFASPNPINKIEFIRAFSKEIKLLLRYYKVASLHGEKRVGNI